MIPLTNQSISQGLQELETGTEEPDRRPILLHHEAKLEPVGELLATEARGSEICSLGTIILITKHLGDTGDSFRL